MNQARLLHMSFTDGLISPRFLNKKSLDAVS